MSWILEPSEKTSTDPAPRPPQTEKRRRPDILEIRDRPLSQVLADYFLCTACATVVGNNDDNEVSSRCPHCGTTVTEAQYYYKRPVHTIIDLMQAAYHWPSGDRAQAQGGSQTPRHDQRVALVVFYCELADVVFDHFLRRLMIALQIPPKVAKRLLADHHNHEARAARLFPTLTNSEWRTTVETLTNESGVDHIGTLVFRRKAFALKNAFFATGDSSAIDAEAATACMHRIAPLLELFTALHNLFIPKIHFNRSA